MIEDTDLDKYHTMPSVAVDDAGYIHVVGNSHNTPYPQISSMQAAGNGDCSHPNANAVANAGTVCASPLPYYVSATPEDITSMEFVPWTSSQQIPGTRITYATFFAANTGGDGGDTWHHYVPDDNSPQTNAVQPPAVLLDQRYLFQTGNVRFQALNNDGQLKATVWTAAFSAP